MLEHFEGFKGWFCDQSQEVNCDTLNFEEYPFEIFDCSTVLGQSFDEWYLPKDEATGLNVYQPTHYEVSMVFDSLKEGDQTDGFFYYTGESTVHFTNLKKICVINIHVNKQERFR